MKFKSINDVANLKGKKVLLRVDFNVPIIGTRIFDDYKIVRQLPTIKYLIKKKSKIIILTHLGRPKGGQKEKKHSTAPLANRLSELLDKKVEHVDDVVGFSAATAISKMKNSEIVFLENIRFEPGELTNSKQLAIKLSKMADLYVNEAFGVCHRAHSSLSAVTKYLPSYGGLLLEKELASLNKAQKPKKPLVVVIGGAKLETKLPIIKIFKKRADFILVGGALANNFFAAHGLAVGRSIVDKRSIKEAKKLGNKNIIIPIDVVVGKKNNKWQPRVKSINSVEQDEYIFDIGPETIKTYAKIIKQANTILWNGPLGMFEEKNYRHGTLAIGQLIAARSKGQAFGIVGGGETVEALKMTKMIDYVDWVSTGGGAMLTYLSGGNMPGLEGIISN